MRNRYVLVADLVAIALCVLGAFVLRLDWFFGRQAEHTQAFDFLMVASLLVKPAVFWLFGLYRRYWQYASIRDLLVVFMAVSAASVAMAVVVSIAVITGAVPSFARSILAIDWLLTLATVSGIRLSVRRLAEARTRPIGEPAAAMRPTLVVGAGDAGALVLREIHKTPQLGLQPVGFLDDDPGKLDQRIHGVPVVGPLDALERAVAERGVTQVVIAMPSVDGHVLRRVVDSCRRAGVDARAIPGLFELLDGGANVGRLREVEIADLLRRRPIGADPGVGAYLRDKTVLVTGAGGSIGSELCRQIARRQVARLVLVGHGENSVFDAAVGLRATYPHLTLHTVVADIRNPARIETVFARYRPDVVFHAAAHKHVPLMEEHPEEAVTNNVVGTQILVAAALTHQVDRFVLVSTDKAVAPSSVMGASKRVAESVVRRAAIDHDRTYVVVRFGNVLGSRGSVVPLFKQQIERGGPITVTHPEMRRFFMTISEAVYLVLKAGGLARSGDLFVLNMGEPVRIVDLAEDLMRLSGLRPGEIPIEYSGPRAGEKLEEALWEADSVLTPIDDNSEVFRVVEPTAVADLADIDRLVEHLSGAAAAGDREVIRRLLREHVPHLDLARSADVAPGMP